MTHSCPSTTYGRGRRGYRHDVDEQPEPPTSPSSGPEGPPAVASPNLRKGDWIDRLAGIKDDDGTPANVRTLAALRTDATKWLTAARVAVAIYAALGVVGGILLAFVEDEDDFAEEQQPVSRCWDRVGRVRGGLRHRGLRRTDLPAVAGRGRRIVARSRTGRCACN